MGLSKRVENRRRKITKCELCKKNIKGALGLSGHVKRRHNFSIQQYYDKFLKSKDEGNCIACGKVTKFFNVSFGYRDFCSHECEKKHKKNIL